MEMMRVSEVERVLEVMSGVDAEVQELAGFPPTLIEYNYIGATDNSNLARAAWLQLSTLHGQVNLYAMTPATRVCLAAIVKILSRSANNPELSCMLFGHQQITTPSTSRALIMQQEYWQGSDDSGFI